MLSETEIGSFTDYFKDFMFVAEICLKGHKASLLQTLALPVAGDMKSIKSL